MSETRTINKGTTSPPPRAQTRSIPRAPKWTLVYDGACGMCEAGSARLVRWARPGDVERADFRPPGAAERLGVDRARCESSMQLVCSADPSRVYEGAEAVARVLATRPLWRLVTWVYWVPVVRQLFDAAYRAVARRRFRVSRALGLNGAASCETGACAAKGEP